MSLDMEELLSPDEKTRRDASLKLQDLVSQNPAEFVTKTPELLGYMTSTEDDYVALQISSALTSLNGIQPQFATPYSDKVMTTLEMLAQRPMGQDTMWEPTAMNLFQLVQTQLQTNPAMLEPALPMLFSLMQAGDNIKYAASAPVITAGMQNPVILKDHVPAIFGAIRSGFSTLSTALMNLYNYNPEAFHDEFDYVMRLYQTDPTIQSMTLTILNTIAKNKPELFTSAHIAILQPGFMNPSYASMMAMVFEGIAAHSPELLVSAIPSMQQAVQYNDNLLMQVPNIIGLIGRSSIESATQVLPILLEFLNKANDIATAQILGELRNLAELDKSLIEPHLQRIRGYEDSPQEYVRDQARLLVDYMEGKDVRSLADTISQQNEMIKAAATSTEDLMKYIDDNISMLKDFLADITKKLPTPIEFSTEGRVRRTILLHFICDKVDDRCIFPKDRSFTTETKDWNKWLKIAFSGIKVGRSIITPMAAGGAMGALKSAYDAYRSKEDKDYLAYISEPFLTSTEQDHLIEQLRAAKFFDVFQYDAQIAGWVCTMCHLPV